MSLSLYHTTLNKSIKTHMIFGIQDIMITHQIIGKIIGQEQIENSACGNILKANKLHRFQKMWTVMLRTKIIH